MKDLLDAKWGVSQTDLPQLLRAAQSVLWGADSSSLLFTQLAAITDGWKNGAGVNNAFQRCKPLGAQESLPGIAIHFGNFQRSEIMARPAGDGRLTCESCRSIDVREWARRGYLRPGQRFSWSWSVVATLRQH
jgi:hypothetical protein